MKSRKGFTLVELLVVIIIIGVLASVMSLSMGNTTASAKAATIIKNIELCKTAANLYYANNHSEADLAESTASKFLVIDEYAFDEYEAEYITNWSFFDDNAAGSIVYAIDEEGYGYKGWAITVDFHEDPVSKDIANALVKNVMYKSLEDTLPEEGKFKVTLYNSKVEIIEDEDETTDDDGEGD